MYKDINVFQEDGIARIQFNRPEVLNAVSNTLAVEVVDFIKKLKEEGGCRVLILSGNEKSFTVGADTDAAVNMDAEEYEAYLANFREMLKQIESFPAPVIAMIDGYAFGGGAEIACVCDIRFGSDNAKFRFPGASYGLVVSAYSLSTIVNLPKAKELMFGSLITNAEESYKIGLLNQLVARESLEEYTLSYAQKIVKNPILPVEKIKDVLNKSVGQDKVQRKQIEATANQFLIENTNQRQTFSSFTKKRREARDW